jgi:hypothetical protein
MSAMDTTIDAAPVKTATSYWIISSLALVWMLIGVMAWTADLMTDEAAVAKMSEVQQQLFAARPQWLFIVYAIAIFSGLIGAIGLLMRKGWTTMAFAVSLAAVVVQFGYTFIGLDAVRLLGPATALPFPIVIFAIGVFLLWYSMKAKWDGRLQ